MPQKHRKMIHPLPLAAQRALLSLFKGECLVGSAETLHLLKAKNMVNITDDGAIKMTTLGTLSARVLQRARIERKHRAGHVKMAKMAAVTLCLAGAPASADAACSPSDAIGTWDVYMLRASGIAGYWQGVKIDSAGNMSGSMQWFDAASSPFTISTAEPIKVDAACHVTGQFRITHGATEAETLAFRGTMTRDKGQIVSTPFVNPLFNVQGGTLTHLVKK